MGIDNLQNPPIRDPIIKIDNRSLQDENSEDVDCYVTAVWQRYFARLNSVLLAAGFGQVVDPTQIKSSDVLGGNQTTVPASTVWPTILTAFFVPFSISKQAVAKRIFVWNGAAVAGNISVAIYGEDSVKRVNLDNVAQAGTNQIQIFDIADTPLNPGKYFLAMLATNGAAEVMAYAEAAGFNLFNGIKEQAVGGFAFPSTATMTESVTRNFLPLIAVSFVP